MRKLLTIIFVLCTAYSFAQAPVPRSSAFVTAQDQRVAFMLNMKIPVANDTTLNGGLDSIGSLIYRKLDTSIYLRVPVNAFQNKWINIMSLSAADTASLSARINQKLNISDTASMLSKYLRSIDTASLSNRINQKLNISDTASMLSKYLRSIDTASLSTRINQRLPISDTANMLSKYLRKIDTASLSNRINQRLLISDTSTMLSKYLRKVDTASLSNRINQRLLISDTSLMLSPYLRKIDTFPRFNPIAGPGIQITGAYPNQTFTNTGGGGGTNGMDTVTTTNQMISYSGTGSVLLVKDSSRGGIFFYTLLPATPDSGTVFAATGKGSGYWVRRWDQKEIYLTWFDAKGDGVTDNSSIIRWVCSLLRANGGGTLIIPQGTYLVSRGGSPAQMFLLGSNTRVIGQGIGKTILKLNPTDLFNFRRMFQFDATSAAVYNVEIANMTIDMSNIYTTYPPPPEFGGDAQNAGIFTFSQNYSVNNSNFHDLEIKNVTGDIIGIGRNTNNTHIWNLYFNDYLRQGVSPGGAFSNGLWVDHIFRQPNLVVTGIGGQDVHSEPSDTIYNVNVSNSRIADWSLSGISGGTFVNNDVYGSANNIMNFVSDFVVAENKIPNGTFQMSPASPGNIKIINNNLKKIYFTTASGAPRNPGRILIQGNTLNNDNDYGIHINNIVGVDIKNNTITTDSSQGIYVVNGDYANIIGNTVTVNGGGTFQGIYEVIVSTNFGAGMSSIHGNTVKAPDRGIQVTAAAVKYGQNFVEAPTKVITTGTTGTSNTGKVFPYADPNGRQILSVSSFPVNYGVYAVGDIATVASGTNGTPKDYICSGAGAFYRGKWQNDTAYFINEYVRDTGSGGATNYIYVSIAPGGQAEDPSSDVDNTYWQLASTTVATFRPGPPQNMLFAGSGNPEGVVTAPVGSIYQNTAATNVNNILWGKISGTGNTGWDTLNTGTSGPGAAIESLNGQTNAIQTFATPVITNVGPSVVSSAGVHTFNIPVAKAIGDSLAAQPVVNQYIQNLAKSVSDSILRVSGDTLKAKGILVTGDTGVVVSKGGGDSANIYRIRNTAPDSMLVGTVAQLRANNSARFESAITTDFGQGVWYYDPSDAVSTDNTGLVIVDAGSRRWKRIYSGVIEAQWFGVVGDSGSDQFTALNLAYTSMPLKSTLGLPRGVILVSGLLNLQLTKNIQGLGPNVTTIKKVNNSSTVNTLRLMNPNTTSISLDSLIYLTGFTVDGNRANQSIITVDTGIVIRNQSTSGDFGAVIKDVSVINTIGPGFVLVGRNGPTKLSNAEALDTKIGFLISGTDATYTNIAAGRSDSIGVWVNPSGNNNRFVNIKTWGSTTDIGISNQGQRNEYTNVEVQEVTNVGIHMGGNSSQWNNVIIDRLYDSTNSIALEINTTDSRFTGTVTNYVKYANGTTTTNAYLINNVLSRRNNINIKSTSAGARNLFLNGFTSTDTATYCEIYHATLGTQYYPAIAGLYTPTIANTVNVSASTVQECGFQRNDSTITVYGTLLITPTNTTTLTSFTLTLPVASDIPTSAALSGGGTISTGAAFLNGYSDGNTSSDLATFSYYSTTANPTSNSVKFRFSYKFR